MPETNNTGLPFLKKILLRDKDLRSVDWDGTPFGTVSMWPEALKLSVGLFLNSPIPKIICWGKDLNCIYNKAFRVFLKSHHCPTADPGTSLKIAIPAMYKELASPLEKISQKIEISHNHSFKIDKTGRSTLPAGNYHIQCNAIFEPDDKTGGILLTIRQGDAPVESSEDADKESISLDTILNLVNVGIAQLAGDDFRVQYVNNVFSELAGKPASYFLDKPILELFPDQKNYFYSIFEKIYSSGKSVQQNQVPVRFLRNGTSAEFFLNLVFYPLLNSGGLPDSIMVVAVDETELVQQKKRLKERELLFSSIVSNSRMGFLILRGERFIIEYANDTIYRKIWQLEPAKALGKPLLELFPELEDQKYGQQIRDTYYRRKIMTGKRSLVLINTGKGLQEFYLDYESGPLLDSEGRVSGVSVNIYDVTDEVVAEKKKQESQQLLELAIDAAGLALWELDSSGNFTHTDELIKILGFKKGQRITPQKLSEIMHPKDLDLRWKAYNAALKSGLYEYDARMRRPDGSTAYIRVKGKMFFDSEKKPLKTIGTVMDITQIKENQKELIRKEQRLRQLILQAPVAIGIVKGPDYKVEIINDAAQLLLGRSEEQLVGNPILSVMTEVDVNGAKYLLDQVFYKGKNISAKEFPIKFLRKGKLEKVYVNFEYDPIRDEQNGVTGIMVVGMEVTEQVANRKKIEASEQQFRLLANSVPHLVWISDKSGHILFTNQTLEQYSGCSLELLSREGFIYLVHPEEKERVQKKWDQALESSTEYIDEYRIAGKDGNFRWYLTRAVPLKNESNPMQTWIATSTDIQEIKEQDFQKNYFISRASHELRTPLTSIKGYVQILFNLFQNTSEKLVLTSLQRMDMQVNKLTKLTEELLDTTRLNSDNMTIEKEKVNLVQLLQEAIDDMSATNPNYDIQFTGEKSIQLSADRNRLSQVMNNILSNAIKYSLNEKVIIVDAGIEDSMARVSVKDRGIGIDKRFYKNIFEKFYRVSGKNEDTFPGLGIGLFLVDEIIKKHGGYVTVESELGKGSCFTFFIPVDK